MIYFFMRDLLLDPEYEHLRKLPLRVYKQGYPTVKYNGSWVRVHEIVAGKKDGLEIDHINRNKMDNRAFNLRHVTHAENLRNRNGWGKLPKWVYKDNNPHRLKPYKVMRKINSRTVHIGNYETVEEAERESIKAFGNP